MSRLDTSVWMAKQAGKGAKRAARLAASMGEPVAAGNDLAATLAKVEAAPAPAATPAASVSAVASEEMNAALSKMHESMRRLRSLEPAPAVTPAAPVPAAMPAAPAAAVGDLVGSAALAKATPTTAVAPSSLGQRFANALRVSSKPAPNINPDPVAAKLQQALTNVPTATPGVFQRGYAAVKPLLSRGAELATKGGQALKAVGPMVKGNPKASIAAALAAAVASIGVGKSVAGQMGTTPQNFGSAPKSIPLAAAAQARGAEAAASMVPEGWSKLSNPMKALMLLTGGGLAAGGGMLAYKALQRRKRPQQPQVDEEV